LTRKEKEEQVAWLKEQFRDAQSVVLTNFSGLTVAEMNSLRSRLREHNIRYKVIKNTMMRRAHPGTDVAVLDEFLQGPRAAAWTDEVNVAPLMAKTLVDFAKDHHQLDVIAGVLNGQKLSPADVEALSSLPSREELLAKLLGTLIAPLGAFVGTLAAVPRSFLNVVKAIEEQKNSSPEAAQG
jgi:large subunit ribosomal protein L10